MAFDDEADGFAGQDQVGDVLEEELGVGKNVGAFGKELDAVFEEDLAESAGELGGREQGDDGFGEVFFAAVRRGRGSGFVPGGRREGGEGGTSGGTGGHGFGSVLDGDAGGGDGLDSEHLVALGFGGDGAQVGRMEGDLEFLAAGDGFGEFADEFVRRFGGRRGLGGLGEERLTVAGELVDLGLGEAQLRHHVGELEAELFNGGDFVAQRAV